MNKAKTRNKTTLLSVALIVVSLIIILATTLAYFTDRATRENSMQFGKISLVGEKGFESASTSLKDKLPGDKITDTISFYKAVDSESMYVRAKVKFSSDSDVESIQNFVTQLNNGAFNIKEYTTGNYKWSDKMSNYYYLMKQDGSAVYELNTSEEIILADSLVLSTELTQDSEYSQYMESITLNVEIQALQFASIANDFDTVNTKFGEVFGEKAVKPITLDGATFGYYDGTTNISDQFNEYYYYVDYGYYPQTLYTGSATMTQVTGETYTIDGSPCNVYTDGTDKYVEFNANSKNNVYLSSSNSNYSNYQKYEGTKYYKIEPVRWLILGYGDNTAISDSDISVSNGSLILNDTSKGLLVLSEKVLVQQVFNSSFANNWSTSDLKTFMNGTLLNDLFTTEEIGYIKEDTSLNTTYCGSGVKTTDNKLFPLSCTQDSYNTDTYQVQQGLKSGTSNAVYKTVYTILKAKGTDLGFATGCYNSSGYTSWWLRAGYYNFKNYACSVLTSGRVENGNLVDSTGLGVRAAFVMDIA